MTCPDCHSHNVEDTGEDSLGNTEYECMDCGYQFDSTEVG